MRIEPGHPLYTRLQSLYHKNGGRHVEFAGQRYEVIEDTVRVFVMVPKISADEAYTKTSF